MAKKILIMKPRAKKTLILKKKTPSVPPSYTPKTGIYVKGKGKKYVA